MVLRGLLAGFAAIVLSGLLAGPADAYSTVRSAPTTVTGALRPIDFTFDVIPKGSYGYQPSTLNWEQSDFFDELYRVSFDLFLGGTWEADGYDTSDPSNRYYESGSDAGVWRLQLNLLGVLDDSGKTITAFAPDNFPVGVLDFTDGSRADFDDAEGLPFNDTPIVHDRFLLYTRPGSLDRPECDPDVSLLFGLVQPCQVLTLSIEDLEKDDSAFKADLFDALTHYGPFVECEEGNKPGAAEAEAPQYSCNYYADNKTKLLPSYGWLQAGILSKLIDDGLVRGYYLNGGTGDRARTSLVGRQECLPGAVDCGRELSRGVSASGPISSSSVPEPGTLALLALGLAGMGLRRRSR